MTAPLDIPGAATLAELAGVAYVRADVVLAVTATAATYYCAPGDWLASPAYGEHARRTRIAELRAELAALEGTPAPQDVPCPECGAYFAAGRALTTHRARKHGWRADNARRAPDAVAAGAEAEALGRLADEALADLEAGRTLPAEAVLDAASEPVAHPDRRACQYCGVVCRGAVGLRNHERSCMRNPDRKPGYATGLRKTPPPTDAEVRAALATTFVDSPKLRELVAEPAAFRCACGGAFAESLKEPGRCIRCTGEYRARLSA